MNIGYTRVSRKSENLESQIEALKKAGCKKIFEEKKLSKQTDDRPKLQEAITHLNQGDTFIVTRLDRCAKNVKDLHAIIAKLNAKGVEFKATEQALDTSSPTGRLMMGLLSIISEFEMDLRAERQADGIVSALKHGVKFGRQSVFDDERVVEAIELQKQGMTNQDIADKYGIGRSTLLRYISKYKKSSQYQANTNPSQEADWEEIPLNDKEKKNYPQIKKAYYLDVYVLKKPKMNIKVYKHDKHNKKIYYEKVTIQYGEKVSDILDFFLNPMTQSEILEDLYHIVIGFNSPDKNELEAELRRYLDTLYPLILKPSQIELKKYEKDIDTSSLDYSDPFNPVPFNDKEALTKEIKKEEDSTSNVHDEEDKDINDMYKLVGLDKP